MSSLARLAGEGGGECQRQSACWSSSKPAADGGLMQGTFPGAANSLIWDWSGPEVATPGRSNSGMG